MTVVTPLVIFAAHAAHARIEVGSDDGGLVIKNTGAYPLLSVAIKGQRILFLDTGEALWRPPLNTAHPVTGRYRLMDWEAALSGLDQETAPFHLCTAGVTPDAFNPGQAGRPASSLNAQALNSAPQTLWRSWFRGPPLRMALVAHALRFAPVEVLGSILSVSSPLDFKPAVWPMGFEQLPQISDALRYAIENHGVGGLETLLALSSWRRDRGFERPELAFAFHTHAPTFTKVLKEAGDPASKEALSILEADVPDLASVSQTLTRAFEDGREEIAAIYAVRVALSWRLQPHKTPASLAVRLVCGGLDSGARRALRADRLLAARAYLTLGAKLCGATRAYRGRVADLARAYADFARTGQDGQAAAQWLKGAYWFAKMSGDRAQLADRLAELAVLHFDRADVQSGDLLLEEARDFEPFRPAVVAAAERRPGIGVDLRARLGIIIICFGLGYFAFRRLKRVFRRRPDAVRDVSLKGGPRTW